MAAGTLGITLHKLAFWQIVGGNREEDKDADCRFIIFQQLRNQARAHGVGAVIPCPANQHRTEKRILRVDKYFRIHGPNSERQVYRRRKAIELVNLRSKEQPCFNRHRIKGACAHVNRHTRCSTSSPYSSQW